MLKRPRYGDNPFIIFRNCVGVAKLSYALVTCSPLSLLEAQVEFDPALRASLEKIVTALGLGFGDWQWRFATLLIKLGGLGILLAGDIISYAFLASRLKTSTLQAKIISKMGLVPRLTIPMFSEGSLCPSCNVHRMDEWGDHVVHCSSKVGVKCRHNLVHGILVNICSKVGIMMCKEARIGFLLEDGKDL
ncbi:hypothetical protein Tco_1209660 [Tanacetum coccineum]